jgi:hypothetical protein
VIVETEFVSACYMESVDEKGDGGHAHGTGLKWGQRVVASRERDAYHQLSKGCSEEPNNYGVQLVLCPFSTTIPRLHGSRRRSRPGIDALPTRCPTAAAAAVTQASAQPTTYARAHPAADGQPSWR